MVKYKSYMDIQEIDTNAYIERAGKITAREARKIRDISDFYATPNIHRPEYSTLRYNILRDAIYKNGKESKFLLKSVELAVRFYDERWYEMTRDLDLLKRASAFDTTEENVMMYDALHDNMIRVLTSQNEKSK